MKKNKQAENLPPSSDEDFWGEDADINVIDTSKPLANYDLLTKGHDWRQRGPYLVCRSCPLEHTQHIGINRQLKGFTKDGKPILVKVF